MRLRGYLPRRRMKLPARCHHCGLEPEKDRCCETILFAKKARHGRGSLTVRNQQVCCCGKVQLISCKIWRLPWEFIGHDSCVTSWTADPLPLRQQGRDCELGPAQHNRTLWNKDRGFLGTSWFIDGVLDRHALRQLHVRVTSRLAGKSAFHRRHYI